jgi:hypothetical protein
MFRVAQRALFAVPALALVLAFVLLGGERQALAGVPHTPTRFDDPVPDGCLPGDCSLREALISASNNPGPDSITLPAGTYTLSIPGAEEGAGATGDLNVNDALTLAGAASGTTIIDGGGVDRVFFVGQSGHLNLSGVTIRGGQPIYNGGGILNVGTLTISDSVVRDNAADSGGGIASGASSGHLVMNRTTIRDNSSGAGGGLFLADAGSEATITNSTISQNTATTYSGGIHIQSGTDVTLTNVTITDNSSPPPTAMTVTADAQAMLTNVTVADNVSTTQFPGAIANYASVSLQNTIVQDAGSNCYGDGTFQSLGHNISGDGTCHLTAPGDQPLTDALLGPLADNGGPTETLALLAGSPAISGGDDAACPFMDQRGFGRVGTCDIGAFEFGGSPVTVKQGDVNCDDEVTAVDALFLLRFVAAIPPFAECLTLAGDVNCDGANTAVDALGVLRYVAGLPANQNEPCTYIGTPV